jgi:hypothetical protein
MYYSVYSGTFTHCTTLLTLEPLDKALLYLQWNHYTLHCSIYSRTIRHCTTLIAVETLDILLPYLHWNLSVLHYSLYVRTFRHYTTLSTVEPSDIALLCNTANFRQCTTLFTLKLLNDWIEIDLIVSAALEALMQIIYLRPLLSVFFTWNEYFGNERPSSVRQRIH